MEHHLIALASRLPPSVRCQVCCLEASADYLARLSDARLEHTNLDWPILLRPGGAFAYLRFERAVSRFRPHIVHSYGFAADIVAGLLRARGANVRIITSRRGEDANRRHHAFRRLVNHVSDKVVCVSQETAAFVESTESPRPGLLTVIPNGVAVSDASHDSRARDTDQTAKSDEKDRPIRFGTLGTVKPIKGTDLLVDAFMQFDRAAHVELLIAGSIDRPWAEALRERARQDPRIRFMGRSSQAAAFSHRWTSSCCRHARRACPMRCSRRWPRAFPASRPTSGRTARCSALPASRRPARFAHRLRTRSSARYPGWRRAKKPVWATERVPGPWSRGATRFLLWCSTTNGCIDRSPGGRRDARRSHRRHAPPNDDYG